MADPISIISLVAITLQGSRVIYELIERVKDAPQSIKELQNDSVVIRHLLQQLNESLDEGVKLVSHVEDALRAPLDDTHMALEDLKSLVEPFVSTKNPKLKGLEWAFKQKDVNDLKKKLKKSQGTLAMALAIAIKRETKLVNTQAHAIMGTQILTLDNVTNLSQDLQTHTTTMGDTQTAILEAVKSFDQKLEARDAESGREQAWQNPTDLIGLSNYLKTVAIARYSPPPTNAAGMSTFDEDFDDDALPDELQCDQSHTVVVYDVETEIEKLLLQESETCAMNDEGQTALHLAAQQDPYLTQRVLSGGLKVDELNIEGETPLMSAVMAENMETVKILLKAGADVNAASDHGRTPLHYAVAYNKDIAVAQLLLRRKSNIAAVDRNGQTALSTAAFGGNDMGCRCLLENGAKVQAREAGGWTALHYLAMRGNPACMDRLLHSAGADVETYYYPERYGLQSNVAYDTSSKRKIALVKLFLDHGVDINARSKGHTALALAVLTCQDMLVRTLLSYNASAQGTSLVCLNWGLSNENLEQLAQSGADIEARDSRHHKTALIWASETGSPAAVKILLDHGAAVNAQDSQGISAL